MAATLARWVVRLRWLILALWLAGATVLWFQAPSLSQQRDQGLANVVPMESEPLQAQIEDVERFGFPLLARTVVVHRDPDGLALSDQIHAVQIAVDATTGDLDGVDTDIAGVLPLTNLGGLLPGSREEGTTIAYYLFFATILFVALVLAAVFRSVLAPVVSLGVTAVSYVVATRAIALGSHFLEISLPSELEPIVVVLLVGVETDYAIFFLSAFRRRLRNGDVDPGDAGSARTGGAVAERHP